MFAALPSTNFVVVPAFRDDGRLRRAHSVVMAIIGVDTTDGSSNNLTRRLCESIDHGKESVTSPVASPVNGAGKHASAVRHCRKDNDAKNEECEIPSEELWANDP